MNLNSTTILLTLNLITFKTFKTVIYTVLSNSNKPILRWRATKLSQADRQISRHPCRYNEIGQRATFYFYILWTNIRQRTCESPKCSTHWLAGEFESQVFAFFTRNSHFRNHLLKLGIIEEDNLCRQFRLPETYSSGF